MKQETVRRLRSLYAIRDDFVVRLVSLAAEAHRIGLHKTGHKLHDAVKQVGYELAEQIRKVERE
jgi:hypothetical protein